MWLYLLSECFIKRTMPTAGWHAPNHSTTVFRISGSAALSAREDDASPFRSQRGLDVTEQYVGKAFPSRVMWDADESADGAERCSDLSKAGHSRGHFLQLEEGLPVAGRGGAAIGEAS